MEENKDLDFFQQALKAFDAPDFPDEPEETEQVPAEAPEQPEEEPAPKGKRWPAILSGVLVALLLLGVFFLDFGTVRMRVESRDLEEGIFFGQSGNEYYKVLWPKVEKVSVGSYVEVSYFFVREVVMEDPNPYMSYILPVWDELWAWRVKSLPNEPSVNVTTGTAPSKEPEYTLTVSIYDQPLTALAMSRPKEYTIEISLPAEEAEALLATFDGHTWVSEDMFNSGPVTSGGAVYSGGKPSDGFIVSIASYAPVGKFVLQSDAPLYREAYFSADGQFMQQGAKIRDLDMMYTILEHIRNAATEEDRLWMEAAYPGEVAYGGNVNASITLERDGTAKIVWTDGFQGFRMGRSMHYIVVGEAVLMWPEDPGLRELLGFCLSEEGLQYSAEHSNTELEWLSHDMLFAARQQAQPTTENTIQFFVPDRELVMSGKYETASERYDLDLDSVVRFREILDGLPWEDTPPGAESTMLLQCSVLLGTDVHMLSWCADGYLYDGNRRTPLMPEDWDFLMELADDLWGKGMGGRYQYVSPESHSYILVLRSDGRYRMEKDGELYSFGRYFQRDQLTVLSDGKGVWYLTYESWSSQKASVSGLEYLEELDGASFIGYDGMVGNDEKVQKLPADGESIWMQVTLPLMDAQTEWRYRTPQQTAELDALLQRQEWLQACASGFLSEAIATIKVMVGDSDAIFESVDLMPNGYLYHDTQYARLSRDDWEELMRILTQVSNTFLSEGYVNEGDLSLTVLNLAKSGEYHVLGAFSMANTGRYVAVGDYLLLDGKAYGYCYLQKHNDGWIVAKSTLTRLQEGRVLIPYDYPDYVYGETIPDAPDTDE